MAASKQFVGACPDDGIATISRIKDGIASFNDNLFQPSATAKRVCADVSHRVGNGNTRQASEPKRPAANFSHSAGDDDGSQTADMAKCILRNGFNPIGNGRILASEFQFIIIRRDNSVAVVARVVVLIVGVYHKALDAIAAIERRVANPFHRGRNGHNASKTTVIKGIVTNFLKGVGKNQSAFQSPAIAKSIAVNNSYSIAVSIINHMIRNGQGARGIGAVNVLQNSHGSTTVVDFIVQVAIGKGLGIHS